MPLEVLSPDDAEVSFLAIVPVDFCFVVAFTSAEVFFSAIAFDFITAVFFGAADDESPAGAFFCFAAGLASGSSFFVFFFCATG
ncbi:MAG: hypothetical protein M3R17_12470 [Bacteroidota bacterium]|nr:hypothetical protein [Bacteroidota bacterium]